MSRKCPILWSLFYLTYGGQLSNIEEELQKAASFVADNYQSLIASLNIPYRDFKNYDK